MSLALAVAALGCRFTTNVERMGPERAPTKPEHVQVYWDSPARPFEIIGRVTAAADLSVGSDAWDNHFKKEAAKLGGDAVVYSLTSIGSAGGTGYQVGSAVAIVPTTTEAKVGYVVVWKDRTTETKAP